MRYGRFNPMARADKDAAIARVRRGEQAKSVAKDIGITKSTLSAWCRIPESPEKIANLACLPLVRIHDNPLCTED